MTDATQTMRLNHLSFPCRDVEATAIFFRDCLGCMITEFGTSRLAKRPGFDIVLEDSSDQAIHWPQNFHFGFETRSLEELRALYDRFDAAGVQIETGVTWHARGSRFFCTAPGGILVEVNTRSDADEAYRRSFT